MNPTTGGAVRGSGVTRTVVALVGASHPEPAAAVTAGAAGLAITTGRDFPGVASVALAVLASQLAVGWHNDWLDAERDRASGRPDKPVARGSVSRRTVAIAAAVAAVATVPLARLSGIAAALAAVIGLGSALIYNWPLKFTPLSPLPYVVSFAALPAFVVFGLPGSVMPPWWLLAAGATLGAGAHFANTIPDLEDDLRHGVRGLPHRLGRGAGTVLALVLLAAASAVLVVAPAGSPSSVGILGLCAAMVVLAVGGYAQRRHPRSRAAFRAVLVAALIDVGLLLAAGSAI
jgi:4-hydroxybenzoate polyprenyltransferase